MTTIASWTPRTLEEELLHRYWRRVGGRVYLEVPIGGPGGAGDWPPGSKIRRIDAVRMESTGLQQDGIIRFNDHRDEFCESVHGSCPELIEIKQLLGRHVIGQVIAGVDMFNREYRPEMVIPVVLCQEGDPALEWVCERRGITVQIA